MKIYFGRLSNVRSCLFIKSKLKYLFYFQKFEDQKNPKNSATINSFAWHSKDYNRLMVSFNTFNILMDLIVADHCPIGFSMNDKLNVCMNDKVLTLDMIQNDSDIDIGVKMKYRALKSYGVQDYLLNINLISDEKNENDLKYLWSWFDCGCF